MSSKTPTSASLSVFALFFVLAFSLESHASFFQNWCEEPAQRRLEKLAPEQDPCLDRGTSLVALTADRVVYLCKDGLAQDSFDLSLGRGGLGKTKDGDLKTPVGTYTLGAPRESDSFGIFIPVGYPTAQQKAEGYTGGAIGVHGPARMFRCAGLLNVSLNWTQGCLAVATDGFIAEIANFVKTNKVRTIHIF